MDCIPRARQAESGRLLVGNCEELNVLDSGLSGPIVFNAMDGTVSVSATEAANMIADNFSTCDGTISGFPVYAKTPSCRDVGDAPDRDLVVARPQPSSTGSLFGHTITCPTSFGLVPEVVPVEIIPAAFPTEAPEGLFTLGFTEVAATSCAPATRKFYAVPSLNASEVDAADLSTCDFPTTPDDATSGLAMWEINEAGTKWSLCKVANQTLVDYFQTKFGSQYLEIPRTILLTQDYGTGSTSPLNTPLALPVVTYDVTTLPGYLDTHTTINLFVECWLDSQTRSADCYVEINGRVYATARARFAGSSGDASNSVIVKIPADKKLVIAPFHIQYTAGTWTALSFRVSADGLQ